MFVVSSIVLCVFRYEDDRLYIEYLFVIIVEYEDVWGYGSVGFFDFGGVGNFRV